MWISVIGIRVPAIFMGIMATMGSYDSIAE